MKRALFLYLKAFSFTGGIEKFNRAFLKALYDLTKEGSVHASAISAYDSFIDERYFHPSNFTGFRGNRFLFFLFALLKSIKFDLVVLGHVNLAIVGYCIKKVKPSVKIILVVHGIEVWEKQRGIKQKILQEADWIFSVSNFTRSRIIANHPSVSPEKIRIFPNTIDPFFTMPVTFEKPAYLLKRYNLSPEDKILLTITRLNSTEKYKGYDQIIKLMSQLTSSNGKLKYVLGGEANRTEEKRIADLIHKHGLKDKIILTGFVKEEEIVDHYLLADVFAMPSKKEGFGIVFIEALSCGLRVIAGSKDGSAEALQNGSLGILVDPDSSEEIASAINKLLMEEYHKPYELQRKVLESFCFSNYKNRLRDYLLSK